MTNEPQTEVPSEVYGQGLAHTPVRVCLDDMTIGDLELMDSGTITPKEMVDFLQRMVKGADVRRMPLSMLPKIMAAIKEAVKEMRTNPN